MIQQLIQPVAINNHTSSPFHQVTQTRFASAKDVFVSSAYRVHFGKLSKAQELLGEKILILTGNGGKKQFFGEALGMQGPVLNTNVQWAFLTGGEEIDTVMGAVEETGKTFVENATLKAQAGHDFYNAQNENVSVLGEDFGIVLTSPKVQEFYEETLKKVDPECPGIAGVYSKRWVTPKVYKYLTGEDLPKKPNDYHRNKAVVALLDNLDLKGEERNAEFSSAFVVITPSGKRYIAEGQEPVLIVEGEAADAALAISEKAGFGFGYIAHPITELGVLKNSSAALTPTENLQYNTRAKALASLKQKIEADLNSK
ncbi:MAG: non-canonical purine NTP pyrophosphatase [Vampirovibrionales bacterium]|nr:non-canonical purine NTP pyrophosphatase [Vampirovibrionales bacterium]